MPHRCLLEKCKNTAYWPYAFCLSHGKSLPLSYHAKLEDIAASNRKPTEDPGRGPDDEGWDDDWEKVYERRLLG